MERIPFCSPSISERDVQYVADSVPHFVGHMADDFQRRFEQAFADYLGVRHAIAVSSRTAALHVALSALGVGLGHEVIVPELMPATSLLPLRYLGAQAAFADVDPQSWCLSPNSCRQSITPRTKAIVVVDLYGNHAEVHRIRAIARARGIALVEDATDALGGSYLNRASGTLGDVGVFGFDRAETLTSGEGGMVTTDCDKLAADIRRSLADAGFDYHISPMQAAMGMAQLERIDDLIARKQQIAEWYRESLHGVAGIQFASTEPFVNHVPSEVAISFDHTVSLNADDFQHALAMHGIECRRMHSPASSLDLYANTPHAKVARSRNANSYTVSPGGIVLPSGTNLTRRQVEEVVGALRSILSSGGRSQSPRRMAA